MTIPRVVCFIDSSNLFSYLRDAFGSGKYRQGALCDAVAGPERELVQWRFYAAVLPDGESDRQKARYEAQQGFFKLIRSRPRGVLCLGRFLVEGEIPHQRLREKGVDVHLAVDLVRLAARDEYDVAIVMSGDEDLVPAIVAVREEHGKRVEIALPAMAQAYHVKKAADGFVDIARETFEKVGL
ncbi:MAG: NYN domain-containing protein [Deltaproteobacteria bacterium]|nr:NYN domain-containing protein [Deltaproteobacteria bacterium]